MDEFAGPQPEPSTPTGDLSGLEGLPPGSALLVVKRGPNAGARFLLDRPVTSAGRHPGSDIFLDEVTVSRKHAEFRWENDELHVVDLGSLNGTYVNREAVDSAVLVNGHEVQLGKFRLMFLHREKNPEPLTGVVNRVAVFAPDCLLRKLVPNQLTAVTDTTVADSSCRVLLRASTTSGIQSVTSPLARQCYMPPW